METGALYLLLDDQCVEFTVLKGGVGSALEATAVFCFSDAYPGFNGHFPGNPVLPAIVQLATVRYTTERATGSNLMLLKYRRTKFRAIVRPEDLVETRIRVEEEKGVLAGSFSLCIMRDNPETVATGNCLFKKV